jgi:hypothetical protein
MYLRRKGRHKCYTKRNPYNFYRQISKCAIKKAPRLQGSTLSFLGSSVRQTSRDT